MKQSSLLSKATRLSSQILSQNGDFHEAPFKHCVVDNCFNNEFSYQLIKGFPDLKSNEWESTNDQDIEIKHRTKWQSEFDIPDEILPAIRIFNSAIFLRAVSKRFKIPKLIPDPYFSGGGLNVTESNGLLDVHVDGNYHDASGLNRRINAILYLNPGWKKGWGGEFGLYNSTGEKLIKKIAPIFNRLVIFDTHDKSFHGLPEPLKFPKGHNRKSIILYYYTKEARPIHQVEVEKPHSALWKKRGILDKKGNKTRNHQ